MKCHIVPQVSVIKVKIHEATGMPAGKQKLQYEVNDLRILNTEYLRARHVMTLLNIKVLENWDLVLFDSPGDFHQRFQLSGVL